MSRPLLNFACEDSRLISIIDNQGAIIPGIYEVARVELPENKSYWLRWMNEIFFGAFGVAFDPIPLGWDKTFWDLRVDRIEVNKPRPPFLIGAATGIQGNPVPGFSRRNHVVESGCWLGSFNDLSMELRGPSMLRLFCEIISGAASDNVTYVGGRLVIFTE